MNTRKIFIKHLLQSSTQYMCINISRIAPLLPLGIKFQSKWKGVGSSKASLTLCINSFRSNIKYLCNGFVWLRIRWIRTGYQPYKEICMYSLVIQTISPRINHEIGPGFDFSGLTKLVLIL